MYLLVVVENCFIMRDNLSIPELSTGSPLINGSDLLHPNHLYTIRLGLTGIGGQKLDLVIEI
jgi:hypothetical protein